MQNIFRILQFLYKVVDFTTLSKTIYQLSQTQNLYSVFGHNSLISGHFNFVIQENAI